MKIERLINWKARASWVHWWKIAYYRAAIIKNNIIKFKPLLQKTKPEKGFIIQAIIRADNLAP